MGIGGVEDEVFGGEGWRRWSGARSKEARVYICRAFVELQGAVEGCIGE